jgi:hypothetical protein
LLEGVNREQIAEWWRPERIELCGFKKQLFRGDGLMLLPATRISLDLDWDGAELQLAAGDGQVALEITPFVIGGTSGGGSGNGYFPGGW